MKIPSGAWIALLVCVVGGVALAQERRVASPPGRSATQVGGTYDERAGYVGGQWIEIRYGRPIKRGRDLFGPADYREFLNDGAPVWRAGANQSTQLLTEAAARLRRPIDSARRIHRLHRPRDRPLDVRRLHVARAAGIRLREQRGALRRVRLHARQGRRSGADAARDGAPRVRPALLAVRRHERQRRAAGAALGHGRRIRRLHRRGMTGIGPRPGRGESLGATVATNDEGRAGPGERQLHVVAAVSY